MLYVRGTGCARLFLDVGTFFKAYYITIAKKSLKVVLLVIQYLMFTTNTI